MIDITIRIIISSFTFISIFSLMYYFKQLKQFFFKITLINTLKRRDDFKQNEGLLGSLILFKYIFITVYLLWLILFFVYLIQYFFQLENPRFIMWLILLIGTPFIFRYILIIQYKLYNHKWK